MTEDRQAVSAAESTALQQSMLASAVMGLVGIAFATASGSDAVLLDGAYSLVAFGMAWIAQRLTPRLEAPGTEHFPLGLVALEPVFNLARAALVLLLLGFAALSALGSLSAGGDPTRAGPAVFYGLLVGLAGLEVARRQGQRAEELRSELLRVDAASFRADGAISLSVGIAFAISAAIGQAGWEAAVPYVDPLVVLALVAWLAGEPWRVMRGASGELLAEAPPEQLRTQVAEAVTRALGDTPWEGRHISVWKLGRRLEVRVTLLLPDAEASFTVAEMDTLRARVAETLAPLAAVVSADVRFTIDERWLPGGTALSAATAATPPSPPPPEES